MSHHNFMFLCIILISSLSICKAELYCYVCSTASGLDSDKCGDDFRLTSVDALTCPYGTCQKTRGYRNEGSKRVIEVTRGCISYTGSPGCREGEQYGISATICTCNEPYCNGADNLIPSKQVSICVGLFLTILALYIL